MSEPGDGRFEEMVEVMRLHNGATPTGVGKTWTYSPTMSVTVSATDGLRIAARLIWDSLVALAHRDTVTFEARTQSFEPFTRETDPSQEPVDP